MPKPPACSLGSAQGDVTVKYEASAAMRVALIVTFRHKEGRKITGRGVGGTKYNIRRL